MGGRARIGLVVATASLHLLLAGSALAGAPGRWEVVAQGGGVPSGGAQEIGLTRGADGVLHVAWVHETAPLAANLNHRPISAAGRLGSTATIIPGWVGLQAPALLAGPDGALRVFAGGQRSTDTEDPFVGLVTAAAPASGSPWSQPEVVLNRNGAFGRTMAATAAPDGTPLQAWYGSPSDVIVHRGLSGEVADTVLRAQAAGNEIRPNLATDTSGAVWVGWCNLRSGTNVQRVDGASGAAAGAPIALAGARSGGQATCVLESTDARRVPMAARAGGGVYVAGATGAPGLTGVAVWRLGADGGTSAPVRVARGQGVGHAEPALAAAPDGRVWVAWVERRGGSARLVARRSDPTGRTWGAPVTAPLARGLTLGAVNGSAQQGRLDALGLFARRDGAGSLRHTQLLPGLTVRRSGRVRRGDERARVSFLVEDAGAPVRGARVRAGGASALTGSDGRASLEVRRTARRRLGAVAKRSGYATGRIVLRCC